MAAGPAAARAFLACRPASAFWASAAVQQHAGGACSCSLHSSAASAVPADAGMLQPQSVWCVGRNYAEHARELGHQVPTEAPMIFLKSGSTVLPPGKLVLPSWSNDVHHEVELAIEVGEDLQPSRAAVALDLTARDVQAKLKAQQWPWTLAKSFTGSTPLGPAFSLKGLDVSTLQLDLHVNGKRRQHGRASDMVFSVPTQLAYVAAHFPLRPGDVMLTGTPPGVSVMRAGDELVARVMAADGRVLSEGVWQVEAAPGRG